MYGDVSRKKAGSAIILMVSFILIASGISMFAENSEGLVSKGYATRINLSSLIPYHAQSADEMTGEACLQMTFDYYGPSITQQDIRNVTTGRLESGVASPDELVRASHFSSQSLARGNPSQRGYSERSLGYGGFMYDWTNSERNPSPRFNSRFTDLYTALTNGYPILLYMYKDIPPVINPNPSGPGIDPNNPQPNPEVPDPQVTPEDLDALEKVWRLMVGYDVSIGNGEIIFHDPLPEGVGYLGGPEVRIKRDDFDRMWNITTRMDQTIDTHRIGIAAAPWSIDLTLPSNEKAEAGTTFEIEANITYSAPIAMEGIAVQDPSALLTIPEEYELVSGGRVRSLSITGPRSWSVVNWTVRTPDRSYSGQDIKFYLNTSGQVVSSSPAYRDIIGYGTSFEVETWGYLNHPPVISSAKVTPERIPDDGSIQPIITCRVDDEDGNLNQVTIDLSKAGGISTQRMYDDGRSGGDEEAGDGIYSYMIRKELSKGSKTMIITAADTKQGEDTAEVTLEVADAAEFTEAPVFIDQGATPDTVPNDGFTTSLLWATVEDPENDILSVYADLTNIGGENKQRLYDDGTSGDVFSDDGTYSVEFIVSPAVPLAKYDITITAEDGVGHLTTATVEIEIIIPPVPPQVEDVMADPDIVPNDGKSKTTITALVTDLNDDVVEVHANLLSIQGSRKVSMRDDGVYPDQAGGDDVWTLEINISTSASTGSRSIEITAEDSMGGTDSKDLILTVIQANNPPNIIDYWLDRSTAVMGDEISVFVNVSDQDNDIASVELDLSELGLGKVGLNDNGQFPDAASSDMIYSGSFLLEGNISAGDYNITITVTDFAGDKDTAVTKITIEGEGESTLISLNQEVFIGIPIGLGILLLILLVFFLIRKQRAPAAQKQFRPIQQGAGPRPPYGTRPAQMR
ncbi:MAG: hypothetical protein ACMUIG_02170 [Thermoplasmatota archaeon]